MRLATTLGALTVISACLLNSSYGQEAAADVDPAPRVRLETTLGGIILRLDRVKAPIRVDNFLRYVDDGFYDGLIFHRVKSNFMIQGGGYDENMVQRTAGVRPPIQNEADNGLSNKRGTIAMARLNDPDSATCQFFINVVDNTRLDPSNTSPHGYAVFGEVIEGMDVVDKIRDSKTVVHPNDPGHGKEGAVNPDPVVVIKKASRISTGQ